MVVNPGKKKKKKKIWGKNNTLKENRA